MIVYILFVMILFGMNVALINYASQDSVLAFNILIRIFIAMMVSLVWGVFESVDELSVTQFTFAEQPKVVRIELDTPRSKSPKGDSTMTINNTSCEYKSIELAERSVDWFKHPQEMTFAQFFSFPNPVNALDSMSIQGISSVLLVCAMYEYLVHRTIGIFSYLTYSFTVRLISGPRIELLHQFVVRVIRPFLLWLKLGESHYINSNPKRFSTFIATLFSMTIVSLYIAERYTGFDATVPILTLALLWLILMFTAAWNSLCVACGIFWLLIRFNLLPERFCDCNYAYEVSNGN
jgi:hypothetical protein